MLSLRIRKLSIKISFTNSVPVKIVSSGYFLRRYPDENTSVQVRKIYWSEVSDSFKNKKAAK